MTSYTDTLQRGDMISCYQIEDVLGRGGFAVTYLAIDLNLDVHVAIKEYLPREIIQRDEQLNVSASRPEFIDDYNIGLSNFAREAKTLARFKHLNIVRVHQVIHKYNTAYMVMDYEQGQELSDVLADQQTLSEDDLRSILFPIFDGVDEIHRAGLAHRDIKPSNIYLRENGSPVLLDFGAARYTMSETTQQLTAVVTVGYTPIEQYNVSDNDQGPWSDIYALAAVLYEAVTGSMPVDSVTRASSTLTRSEDPLASVSNKAQQHYSEEFLNAIDWGLKMEAEDRPQSIAQWRDAFNGEVKPASDYVRKRPPARPSRLRTRASEPLALTDPAPTESAHPYQSDPRLTEEIPDPRLSVDVRDTRFDPRFDDNIDEIEIVPLNTIEPEFSDDPAQSLNVEPAAGDSQHHELQDDAGDTVAPIRSLERRPSSGAPANTPRSAFASNPVADGTNRDAAGDEPTVRHDGQNHQEPTDNLTLNDTLNNIANNPGQTTHTQELRNVLRRDIVKRNPSPGAEAGRERNPYPQPYRVAKAEQDGTAQDAAAARPSPYPRPLQAEHADEHQSPPLESRPMRSPPVRDDIQFDESDWDYEPPAPPSKLRWLLPAAGLVGVVGASLLFVNKPEMFKLPMAATPELSVSAALEKAQLQMNEEAFIFPEGQSALDYFRLVLSSDPDNIDAQIGVSKLQDAVKLQIIDSIESDDLEGANRLLTRANETGLQIDGLPGSSIDVSSSVLPENTGPIAIDTNQSPWVTGKIADIERLISEQRFAEAKTLFDNTDQYVADAELSNRMKRQIEAGINGTANQSSAPESGDTIVTPVIPSPVVETQPVATTEIELPAAGTEQAIIPEPTTDATEVLARPSNNSSNSTISSSVTTVSSDPTASDADQKIALNDTPETLPSAPRRSFIEGNDATARHLNQLRTAIEAKSLRRVLDVSNSLPEERTEFLRKMFQRYDRLDVTIDDINTASDSATARLSVSMFNQRGDGSFYSAGKWNGVTLETDRRNGVWQKIQW